jgi:hypothetical protein
MVFNPLYRVRIVNKNCFNRVTDFFCTQVIKEMTGTVKEVKRRNFTVKLDPSMIPRKSPTNIRVLEQIIRSQQEQINQLADQMEYLLLQVADTKKKRIVRRKSPYARVIRQ